MMGIINFFLSAYRQSSIYPMNCSTISTVLFRIFLTHQQFEIEAQVFDFIGLKTTYILPISILAKFLFHLQSAPEFLPGGRGGRRQNGQFKWLCRQESYSDQMGVYFERGGQTAVLPKNGDFGAKNRFLFLSWKWRKIGLRCVKKYCGNTQLIHSDHF